MNETMNEIKNTGTDAMVDMHLPENNQKVVRFASDIAWHMNETLTDGAIMLCEAFKKADRTDGLNAEDLAHQFQWELFRHSDVYEICVEAYVDLLNRGTRNYHKDADTQAELAKMLSNMSQYLAKESVQRAAGTDSKEAPTDAGFEDVAETLRQLLDNEKLPTGLHVAITAEVERLTQFNRVPLAEALRIQRNQDHSDFEREVKG